MAAQILAKPAAPAPRKVAPPREVLPKVIVDPTLVEPQTVPMPVPRLPAAHRPAPGPRPERHEWMFSRESSPPPTKIDSDELHAATARPIASFFRRVGRFFRN